MLLRPCKSWLLDFGWYFFELFFIAVLNHVALTQICKILKKQSPEFYKKAKFLEKFCKIFRKTPEPGSLF